MLKKIFGWVIIAAFIIVLFITLVFSLGFWGAVAAVIGISVGSVLLVTAIDWVTDRDMRDDKIVWKRAK